MVSDAASLRGGARGVDRGSVRVAGHGEEARRDAVAVRMLGMRGMCPVFPNDSRWGGNGTGTRDRDHPASPRIIHDGKNYSCKFKYGNLLQFHIPSPSG